MLQSVLRSSKFLPQYSLKLRFLSTTGVQEIGNLEDFNKCIKENTKVAVDFYAVWCGPCKFIGPKYDALVGKYPEIKFTRVDVDTNNSTAVKCSINAMPTFHFYYNQTRVGELVGASEEGLKGELEKLKSK